MKNKLIKGGLGLILGLFSFTTVIDASAQTIDSIVEGNNSTSANVTVGNVEAPVYDIEINWDSLKYDWKYDEETKNFKWFPTYRTNCYET